MEYLIKSGSIIAIFYLCYKFFLQKETFFQSNRWFLMTGIIVCTLIPFIIIPTYITIAPQEIFWVINENPAITNLNDNSSFSYFNFNIFL